MLVNIMHVPEWRTVTDDDQALRIGSGVRQIAVERRADLPQRQPLLAGLAYLGHVQTHSRRLRRPRRPQRRAAASGLGGSTVQPMNATPCTSPSWPLNRRRGPISTIGCAVNVIGAGIVRTS